MFKKQLQLLETLKDQKFSVRLREARQTILDKIYSDIFSSNVHPYLKSMNLVGEPFTHFSNDPEQISQIKKIINALYHAELALSDAESVTLRSGIKLLIDVPKAVILSIYRKSIHHIYQAAYLITHLDIDLVEIFSQEMAVLNPLLTLFNAHAEKYSEEARGLLLQKDLLDLPRKMGIVAGVAVDQLDTRDGEVDYEYLTGLGGVLSGYLDKFNGYLERFSSNVSEREPNLDKRKLQELQDDALQLLNALKRVRSSSWFLPLKSLHYIHIIRHTMTLSMSIVEQLGFVNESGQDAVRAKLAELKYKWLPMLLGLTDKIEVHAVLTAGVLSKPLMKRVSSYYQLIIDYAVRYIDFSQKGQELVTLEDSQFVEARLAYTYERLAEDKKILLNVDSAKAAESCKFHAILNNNIIAYISEHIEDLKLFPHNISDDPFSINEANILRLEAEAAHNRLHSEPQPFTADQALLAATIEEKIARFVVASQHDRLTNLDSITRDQTLSLYQFYQIRCLKLEGAQQAYNQFHRILVQEAHPPFLNGNHDNLKKKLRNLYRIFQPYLVNGLSLVVGADTVDKGIEIVAGMDRSIVAALSMSTTVFGPQQRVDIALEPLLAFDARVRGRFTSADERLRERCNVFASLVKSRTRQENATKPFEFDLSQEDRANHVIKHKAYSKTISELRQSLYQLTFLFNDSVRAQLNRAKTGLPFPELEEVHQVLAQSGQALGLKRLFNCLYHLEALSVRMETLNDQSTEIVYVYNVFQGSTHLREAFYLVQALATTPYLSVIASEIKQKWQAAYATLMELSGHYSPGAVDSRADDQSGEHTTIFYVLNAMMILPEHITLLRDNQKLSPEGAHAIHQYTEKLNTDIERILGNSSSYFKLFLEIPTMYRLFRELKVKLGDLATASHSVVFDNLGAINDEHLTKMLLVADQLEDNLGLLPGTLTTSLKEILDTFYQGLLEPLGLHSQRHILLATSMHPIEQRILAANKRAARAVFKQNEVREKRELLQRLLTRIHYYKAHNDVDPGMLDSLSSIMIADFKRVWPILDKERHHLSPDIPAANADHQALDGLLNDSDTDKPKLINIEALAAECSSYFQGLDTSQQLILDTANEKIKYLTALKVTQLGVNANFNEIYTKANFKQQVAVIASHQVGFIYCGMEYKHKLVAYLQEVEAEIILAAKNITDIDKKVAEQLHAKLNQFKLANDTKYCHLDRVMAAISRLKQYVIQSDLAIKSHHSLFESEETLRKKAFLVDQLDRFADDKAVLVCERINNIKELVQGQLFKRDILDYHCHDRFSFAWLKQYILSFLELIRLYTPERKHCYNQLVNFVKPLPEGIGQVSGLGLFSAKSKRAYPIPIPIIVTPVLA